MPEEEVATLIAYCLAGLEQCILKFTEHHESFYRLSHFFFNNKKVKDITKCKHLSLGHIVVHFILDKVFRLFAEKRSTNFFNVHILYNIV